MTRPPLPTFADEPVRATHHSRRVAIRPLKRNRHSAKHLAYELWCLQEDRRGAGQPVQNLSTLIGELRAQHPQLTDAALNAGVALFLARLFEENRLQIARHRQRLLQWSGPSLTQQRVDVS